MVSVGELAEKMAQLPPNGLGSNTLVQAAVATFGVPPSVVVLTVQPVSPVVKVPLVTRSPAFARDAPHRATAARQAERDLFGMLNESPVSIAGPGRGKWNW